MFRHFLALLLCFAMVGSVLAGEDGFFDSNGVKIHYKVVGDGEPILLIHGYTANIGLNWEMPGVIKNLAKDYKVIALDNRGHGKSDKPHDTAKYGQEMVEDAVRLLDHLKIPKAHVMGYSMGAMITGKLLTCHPERLLTATLGGAGALREGADSTLFKRLADSLDDGKGMGELIALLTPPGQPAPNKEQIKAINAMVAATNDIKALACAVRSFETFGVSEANLKSNKVPTLALVGDKDPLKKGVDELQGKLANLQIVVLKGGDHMNTFARPDYVESYRASLAKQKAKANSAQQQTTKE